MDTYYLLLDKDTARVPLAWKGCHIIMLVLITVLGFVTGFLFGTGLKGYGNHCVLFAEPVFLNINHTDNTSQVVKFYYARFKNVHVPENHIYLDLASTKWYNINLCYFCQFMPLISMISAIIWISFFIMCSRGGSGYYTDTYSRPWRVVYPALIYSVIATILMFISSTKLSKGLKFFCSEFDEVLNIEGCASEINVYTMYFGEKQNNSIELLTSSSICSWFCSSFWFFHTIILLTRILCVTDFRMVRVIITSQNYDPEKGLRTVQQLPKPKTQAIPPKSSPKPISKDKPTKADDLSKNRSKRSHSQLTQNANRSISDMNLKQRHVKKDVTGSSSDLKRPKVKADDLQRVKPKTEDAKKGESTISSSSGTVQKFTGKLISSMWYSIYPEEPRTSQKKTISDSGRSPKRGEPTRRKSDDNGNLRTNRSKERHFFVSTFVLTPFSAIADQRIVEYEKKTDSEHLTQLRSRSFSSIDAFKKILSLLQLKISFTPESKIIKYTPRERLSIREVASPYKSQSLDDISTKSDTEIRLKSLQFQQDLPSTSRETQPHVTVFPQSTDSSSSSMTDNVDQDNVQSSESFNNLFSISRIDNTNVYLPTRDENSITLTQDELERLRYSLQQYFAHQKEK